MSRTLMVRAAIFALGFVPAAAWTVFLCLFEMQEMHNGIATHDWDDSSFFIAVATIMSASACIGFGLALLPHPFAVTTILLTIALVGGIPAGLFLLCVVPWTGFTVLVPAATAVVYLARAGRA